MPNWCHNVVAITPSSAEAKKMFFELVKAVTEDKFLEWIVPVPPELDEEEIHMFGGEGLEAEARNALRARLAEKFGFPTGYHFRVAKWGTKWEVDCEVIELQPEMIEFSFDSAWSPPSEAYRVLYEKGFDINARYYEPGMSFGGIIEAVHGNGYTESHSDSMHDKNDPIRQMLDEEFGISDDYEEQESE
jgi:hypothetical protein